jgi:hypothetical protein
MALTDIPEFVELAPGGLIRSDDWNNIQRQVRNSVRSHRHTRVASAPADDAASADLALQITSNEIADQAVTGAKLAGAAVTGAKLADGAVGNAKLTDDAVSAAKIQDGAVTATKLQANSVARANIQDEAINRAKLAIQEFASGSVSLAANGGQTQVLIAGNTPNALNLILFPVVTLTNVVSGSGGTNAEVEPSIIYRRATSGGGFATDIFIRLRNVGPSAVTAQFRVLTFAP